MNDMKLTPYCYMAICPYCQHSQYFRIFAISGIPQKITETITCSRCKKDYTNIDEYKE